MKEMASSSSSGADDFASFLASSIELLGEDVPHAYAAMCSRLGACRVLVETDGERCVLSGDGEILSVCRPDAREEHVIVKTTRPALLRLLDGEVALVDAMRRGDVRLRGDLPTLVRFSHALDAYLRGCVRSPGIPGVLRRFRESGAEVVA